MEYKSLEQSYNDSTYTRPVKNLNDIDTILGRQTPKTFYLRIVIQYKILSKSGYSDTSLLSSIKENYERYLQLYAFDISLEKKATDIYHINDTTKGLYTKIAESNKLEKIKTNTQLANAGNIKAMVELRIFLFQDKNYAEAFEWYRKAANAGNTNMNKSGQGITKDSGSSEQNKFVNAIKAKENR